MNYLEMYEAIKSFLASSRDYATISNIAIELLENGNDPNEIERIYNSWQKEITQV